MVSFEIGITMINFLFIRLAFVIKGVCVHRQVTTLLSRGRSNVLCITFLIDYPLEWTENDDIKLFFSLQHSQKNKGLPNHF